MSGRGFDRAVAVVELVTGLGVAAYMIVLGVRGGIAFFVLAAVFLAILAVMSRASWRRVRAREHGAREHGAREHGSREHGSRDDEDRVSTTAPSHRRPERVLTDAGRAALADVVTHLSRTGLLVPPLPDPAELEAAVADQGEPVDDATVLMALLECGHPLEHLAFHDSQVEQLPETLRAQVDDLARLAGDALTVRAEEIDAARVRLRLGDDERVLVRPGRPEDLDTAIHVAVARAVPGPRRLAWLWTDQGVWLAAPRDGVLPGDAWAWVDEG